MEQSENAAVSPDPENGGEGGHGCRSILPESAGKQLSFGDLGVRPRLDTNGYRQPASLLPGGGFHSSAETFHVRGREPRVGADDSGSCCFAGRRDVLSPTSMLETRIVSDRGTVRGFRNRVRAGIVTFFENPEDDHINFRNLEKDKIVIYITSMGVIRETYENCKRVQKILQTHMVRYEEKDLFMSVENQKDLRRRLVGQKKTCIPQVFIDGVLLGGVEELEILNENGELRKILDNFVKISVKSSCNKCGGYRFIPCSACHGSKRSAYRNHFTEEFCELRCIHCNDHGLIRCDMCLDQQE